MFPALTNLIICELDEEGLISPFVNGKVFALVSENLNGETKWPEKFSFPINTLTTLSNL